MEKWKMKKKIVVFLLMICSFWGLFACGSDPYANMTMTVSYNGKEITDGQVINLDIKKTVEYYDEVSLYVEVGNSDEKGITVSGGGGYVETSTDYNSITGVTVVTLKTSSLSRPGGFTLNIDSVVGNLSKKVDVSVNWALETFSFKSDALPAVAKGSSVSLNNIDALIDFYPDEATQRNINIELATLVPSASEAGYEVEDWDDGETFSYVEDGQTYASITDGVLTTYDTYLNSDMETKKVSYPTRTIASTVDGSSEVEEVIILKASYESVSDGVSMVKFLVVPVIEACKEDDVQVYMDTLIEGEEYNIPKSQSGVHEVILIDGSEMSSSEKNDYSYYFEREILFKIFDSVEDKSFDDFKIVTKVSPENGVVDIEPLNGCETKDNGVIEIYPSDRVANLRIKANKPGIYTHEFVVKHKNSKYDGLFNITITIKFTVRDIPDSISIYNNGSLLNDKNGSKAVTIYDYYKGSKGEKIDVRISNEVGEYKYLIFAQDFDYIDSVNLYSTKSNEKMVFASLSGEQLSSTVDGKDYTLFGANDSFYLSHSFNALAQKSVTLNIAIQVSLYADSYTSGKDQFKDLLYCQPLTINFAMGLKSFEFDSDKVYVDLTNSNNYTDNNPSESMALYTLPEGQTMESCLAKCEYDRTLITLYEYTSEGENPRTSIMIKCNNSRLEGSTRVNFVAKNGVTGSVTVATYMPTVYKEYTSDNAIPIAVDVNKKDSGYLYKVSGYTEGSGVSEDMIYKSYALHDEKLVLGVDGEELRYDSIHTLFGLVSKSVRLSFYDYIYNSDSGEFEKYDITNKVKVSFRGVTGFASFNSGVLSFYQTVTEYGKPLYMDVTYVGGYEGIGDDGENEYKEVTVSHTIKIYIYKAMTGIEIETRQEGSLYVLDSLGYFDQSLSTSTISAKFSPDENELGYAWNDVFGIGGEKLTFYYSCEMLNSAVTENGKQVVFYPNDPSIGSTYSLVFGDLFEVGEQVKVGKSYTCNIVSRLSENLKTWINNNYGVGTQAERITQFLNNCIYNKNYTITVNIGAGQFGRMSNSTYVSYICKFAPKINSIKLSYEKQTLDDDGVYFDIRKIQSGIQGNVVIEYTIDTTACLNKEVIVLGVNTAHFSVETEYINGNTGRVIIIPNKNMLGGAIYDGNTALKIILKDNVSGYDSDKDEYSYYSQALNQAIRIKIADGSKEYPFEIRSTSDFEQMIDDINDGNYYYYTLAKNIDLSEISNYEPINIDREDLGYFSLSGYHAYYRNGEKIELYNTLYNLTIKRDVSDLNSDLNLGLFGKIGSAVKLNNLRLENVYIKVETVSDYLGNKTINIGGIAGLISGAKLTSVAVSGSIEIDISARNSELNIGGVVGKDINIGQNGEITGRAGSNSSLSSAKDNVNLGIRLAGTVKSLNVGGLIGSVDKINLDTLQVVSSIVSTMQTVSGVENLGGAIGLSSGSAEINNLEVSPVFTVAGSSNKTGNYGGLIGNLAGGKVSNSVVYFVNNDSADNYIGRLNIRVYGVGSANVGAIAGTIGGSASMEYSYARGFYGIQVEKNVYAGNILVSDIGSSANVGGLVGFVNTTGTISSSYFDGDICVSAEKTGETAPQTNIKAGVLFGDITSGNVNNSYAIGRLYYSLDDESYAPATNYGYANGIVGGANYIERSITIGAISGISYPLVHEFNGNAIFSNVYAVVNSAPVFVAFESVAIMGETAGDLIGKVQNVTVGGAVRPFTALSTPLAVFKTLGYSITNGGKADENDVASNYKWFTNEKIYKIDGYNYPILLTKTGNAMYDLVPSGIGIRFNSSINNIYDISYTETDDDNNEIKHNQLIMFMKKKSDGTYSKDYYEILTESVSGSDKVAVVVEFNGEKIATDLVTIPFNDKIEIRLASSNTNNVIKLQGNKIYPLNEGSATIEIRSYLDQTVKTTFDIKVVAQVNGIMLYEYAGESVEEVDPAMGSRVVYVDEVSNFGISAINTNGYIPSSNVGYIMELLPSGDVDGAVSINGQRYSYQSSGNNVYILDSDSLLNVKGGTIGHVRFKITPYIGLGTTKYIDTSYTGLTLTENAFILNKTGMAVFKIYEFEVLARAISANNSIPTTGINYNSIVSLTTSIETSNVVLSNGNYTILEDVYVNMSKYQDVIDYSVIKLIELRNIEDYGSTLGAKYYFTSPYVFEYKLITLTVISFTIERTTVDTVNKVNTYKISIDTKVSVNSNFYRLNASSNEYDLNSIKFRIDVIPASNMLYASNVPYGIRDNSVVGTTEINITPIGLTDIFMNYYSRGEGLLSNTENTYPNDNETSKIVPGREGLLKITLNEEFSNSSYVTVTLDNKYGGYVRLEQMAGVLQSIDDVAQFDTYKELLYNEPFNSQTFYGIKLQKLSCNLATNTYFDGTYYVKVTLLDGVDYDKVFGADATVDIVVTSYTIDSFGKISETLSEPKVKKLTISPLPTLSVQVNGSNNIYMGVGTKKALDINFTRLTNSLGYSVAPLDSTNVYIMDDASNRVASLDLDYITSGRQYYLAVDVTVSKGATFTIEVFGQEYVEGILETTRSQITINTVAYEVEDVSLEYSSYNEADDEIVFTIGHGESKILKLNMTYVDIVVGSDSDITAYKSVLDTYFRKSSTSISEFSPKQKLEYSLAGTSVTQYVSALETIIVSKNLGLYSIVYNKGQKELSQITTTGLYGGVELLNDSYRTTLSDSSIVEVSYTLLRGMSISSNTFFRISVPYHYENGDVVSGASTAGVYFDKYIEFRVDITENSTEDHPTPIENQADLEKYSGLTGHYILVNNIELVGWVPTPALFNSLDGNGYSIVIKSFSMASIRTENEVNAGIFTEVSEDTLIKNLTIDISNLLTDGTTMNNDIKVVNNSKSTSYVHDQAGKIDLTFVTTLNFGILAGTNNGSLTNIKVVNTRALTGASSETTAKYLHIMTSLIDEDEKATTSNIGGIVGVNSSTGAITNSFVGVNTSNKVGSSYYIENVTNPSATEYNNESDEMSTVQVYPFILAGSNKLAGIAVQNDGIISNTYIKGLGLYNASPNEESSVTAGLVGTNTNKITSSFAEGANIANYRDTAENDIVIEAIGNVAGLVYNNTSVVENSYSNIYLQTNSSSIAGFVFTNTGSIKNSYSTAINRNNLAYGPFTGVINRVAQNTGTYTNCFYLVGDDEVKNDKEPATPMYTSYFSETQSMGLADFWTGFSFVSSPTDNLDDGIWTIVDSLPTIATTQTDTNSFRVLSETAYEYDEEGIVTYALYTYLFDSDYQEGSAGNPLIIESASVFASKIIAKSRELTENGGNKYKVFGGFGAGDILGQLSAVEYVRLVNKLDFVSEPTYLQSQGYSLYEVVFAGKLDGNGMSMENLTITTTLSQLENFGLFRQIGTTETTAQSVIKNIDIKLSGFTSNNNNKVGVLAGTIINATIANVNIDGGNQSIIATNLAGGLAGLIYAYGDNAVHIVDVNISNIEVSASHGSIGGKIDGMESSTSDQSYGRYNLFNIYDKEKNDSENRSFTHLQTSESNGKLTITNTSAISYAGAVAGAIIANNTDAISEIATADRYDINNYRTTTVPSIYNITVKGNIVVGYADHVGGLFGYMSSNTRIKNCKFELSDGQSIMAWNFAGAIVGENHGIIEQAFVAYEDEIQETYDQTIATSGRDNGTTSLFANTYSVAVGGIAGYTSGGAIIDSFAKVNVIEPLAFVVGGLVGYSYLFNYIGYSYSTGAVYGRDAMGGVVGLQVSENDKLSDRLYLSNVVGVNDWGVMRDNISLILYNNYKSLYRTENSYNNFYLKMPEVGNQELLLTSDLMEYYNLDSGVTISSIRAEILEDVTLAEGQTEDEYLTTYLSSYAGDTLDDKLMAYYKATFFTNNISTLNASYKNSHSKIFVGSVVGVSYLFESSNTSSDSSRALFLDSSTLDSLYSSTNLSNVFSSTYGIYQVQSGKLESANKNDTYFASTFQLTTGVNTSASLYSYRVAYLDSVNTYNKYLRTSETSASDIRLNFNNTSKYMDKVNFAKIFTSQEYTEQLLGVFYQTESGEQMKSTYNIFKGYNADRFSSIGLNETFVSRSATTSVWDIDDTDGNYLPFIGDGAIASVVHLYAYNDDDTLDKIFTSNTSNITYYLHVGKNPTDTGTGGSDDTQFVITINDETDINYMLALRSVFIGVTAEGGARPKIVFNITSSKLTTIFNTISGAIFNNLDFVINISNASNDLSNSSKEYSNFGILANTVESSLFDGCTFTLNLPAYADLDCDELTGKYYAKNNGLLFGLLSNSIIKNTTYNLDLNEKVVNISNDIIENFGLFAGVSYSSTLQGITFNFASAMSVISGVSGTINIGTIGYLQNSSYLSSGVFTQVLLTVTNNSADNAYISSTIGYSYNSLINTADIASNRVANRLTVSSGKLDSTLYAGAITGGSENSRFVGVQTISNVTINSPSNTNLVEVGVGAISGKDISSTFGLSAGSSIVGSGSDVTVSVPSKLIYAGGLVGKTNGQTKMYNVYNSGNVVVYNKLSGSSTEVDQKTEYTYVNSYAGGMVGGAFGGITMSMILSAGSVEVSSNSDSLTGIAVGGVIGYMESSCTISKFTVLTDLIMTGSVTGNTNAYASGVVGLNNGSFSANNGYTYSEFACSSNVYTSAITNGRINNVSNVYYAREFAGNDYVSDSKFIGYAYADIYSSVNTLSELYTLISSAGMTQTLSNVKVLNSHTNEEKNNNMSLPVVSALKDISIQMITNQTSNSSGFSRFYVKEINNDEQNSYPSSAPVNYAAITTDVTISNIDNLESGKHISGKTTTTGKVIVTLGYSYNATDYGNLVGENSGVISNIYLRSSKENAGVVYPLNVSLVENNNRAGLITGVYVYERTQSQFGLAKNNLGRIYGSATATVYMANTNELEIYGLVENNSGTIADCYSSSVGYLENAGKRFTTYMVKNNTNGTIMNSFYYIPDVISYYNVVGKIAQTGENSVVSNCSSSQSPSSILNRTNIWTTENGHGQLKGIKDINNAMVVHLYYGTSIASQSDINSIASVKSTLATGNSNYIFSWKIKFYEKDEDLPSYNVVRITSGEKLVDYINSLENDDSYIPANTVVAIFNDIQVNGRFSAFSLSATSMMVGTYRKDFDDDTKAYTTSTISFRSKLDHEFISINSGLIANIVLDGLTIEYADHSNAFAPIGTNAGVIYNVALNNLTISALKTTHVAGLVSKNEAGAVVCKVAITNIDLNSNYAYAKFIYSNRGSVTNVTISGEEEYHRKWLYNGSGVYNG